MNKVVYVLLAFLSFSMLVLLVDCYSGVRKEIAKTMVKRGDFYGNIEDGNFYIYKLTDEAKKKKTIIVPEKIDGNIVSIGYITKSRTLFIPGYSRIDEFESSNLENLYFMTKTICNYKNDEKYQRHRRPIFVLSKEDCPNLKRIFIFDEKRSCNTVNTNVPYDFIKFYFANNTSKKANVSYFLNYDNMNDSNNIDDYYFIDNYDNETIKVMPPEPKRDGYIFWGWYREKECIRKWDFENDIVVSTIGNIKTEVRLYAKWIKK